MRASGSGQVPAAVALLVSLVATKPCAATPTSQTTLVEELAALVRASRWEQVLHSCAARPRPWPAEVALAAARAERHLGHPDRAQEIVQASLPHAGELAAALRIEGAEAALQARRDPWSFLQPLLVAKATAAQRRAVTALLLRAWSELPMSVLSMYQGRPLPRALRRWWDATSATRGENVPLALKVLAERHDDGPAARVVSPLTSRQGLRTGEHLLVGQALLSAGQWREARAWLSAVAPPADPAQAFQLAFLRGRAAYRLGLLDEAVELFQRAVDQATTAAERHSAAVQLARCAEQLGDWRTAEGQWAVAKRADPTAPAGWEGVARARIVGGSVERVCATLATAPAGAREVAAERIAAVLLARSQPEAARTCLTHTPTSSPRARLLRVVLSRTAGRTAQAQQQLAALLADPAAGRWREIALLLATSSPPQPAPTPEPTRLLPQLADLAVRRGADVARGALAAALANDPTWAEVVQGATPMPRSLPKHVVALLDVGLEHDAARLYSTAFPLRLPTEAAWSARVLAAWDSKPAALQAGERVWQALTGVPAGLLPASVTQAVLPADLTKPATAAATAGQVSPALLAAIVRQESRFDASALSPAGARGLGQLMPETARRLGVSEEELWCPERSLELAAQELARLQQVFGNRPAILAAAYNAGEAVVASWLAALGEDCDEVTFTAAIPYQETLEYVLAVVEGIHLARHLETS